MADTIQQSLAFVQALVAAAPHEKPALIARRCGWQPYRERLLALGGCGSGIEGHKPGDPCHSDKNDESSNAIADDVGTVFYHGTSKARLRSILKEGLKSSRAGEVWSAESKKGHVYFSRSRDDAERWAESAGLADATNRRRGAAKPDSVDAAILEIHIPPNVRKRIQRDEHFDVGEEPNLFQLHGDVPPQWIKGVCTGRMVNYESTNWKCRTVKHLAATVPNVVYAVVLFRQEMATLSYRERVGVLLGDGFDESKHPRADDGKFAEKGGDRDETTGPESDRGRGPDTSAAPASGMEPADQRALQKRQPVAFVRQGAQAYNERHGLAPVREGFYVPVDETRARRIADAYDALPDDDHSPETARAYTALADEIQQQWEYAERDLGVTFESWTGDGQPYANSREMQDDVAKNHHIYFFAGGGEPNKYLAARDAHGLSINDKFRAIHDLFGHASEGFQFGPRGEENAWLKHSQMFSPLAQRALTTETRGQNSFVNFGRQNYNDDGTPKNIPAADRPYAKQKAALLPPWATDWQPLLAQHRAYRDRVFDLLYQPHPLTPEAASARTKKGWESRERKTVDPNVLKVHGTTTNPYQTKFVLPDGTRIKGERREEHRNVAAPHRLEDVLDSGAIRYQPEGGIHIRAPMTEAQAQLIADDWNFHYKDHDLFVDVGKPGSPAFDMDQMDVDHFKPPINAEQVRRWINSHFGPQATRGFTSQQPPVAASKDYRARMLALMGGDWDESLHPRDDAGKFAPKGAADEGDRAPEGQPDPLLERVNERLAAKERVRTREIALATAQDMGFEPERVRFIDEEPRKFPVGDQVFTEAAHYSKTLDEIVVNTRQVPPDDAQIVMTHELMHAIYFQVELERDREHKIMREWPEEKFNQYFSRGGFPRPEKIKELRQMFPASAAFADGWGDAYLSTEEQADVYKAMIAADGHTAYSRAYWEAAKSPGGPMNRAIDETLAEVAAAKVTIRLGTPDKLWRDFADGIMAAHKTIQARREEDAHKPRGWHKIA